jgi:hypothetical protein
MGVRSFTRDLGKSARRSVLLSFARGVLEHADQQSPLAPKPVEA